MRKFTEEHEWVEIEGNIGTVGITNNAVEQLSDIVFVELPEQNLECQKGDSVAVVESVKSASDIYAPLSGKIIAVNELLIDNPALMNESAEEKGWIFKIELSDSSEIDALLDEDAYKNLS